MSKKPFNRKEYYEANKDHILALCRSSHLFRTYGITTDDYNVMLLAQNGCCALCKRHQSDFERQLAVDHCHKTGKVRGLLCHSCNTHLGIYENRQEEFQRYLAQTKEKKDGYC